MTDPLYTFNGKDITWVVCIQMRDVTKIIMKELNINFFDAAELFYPSQICEDLTQVDNGLWAESTPYIADRFFEEYHAKKNAKGEC